MRTAVSRLLAASAALALVVPSLAAPEAQHPHFAVEPQLQQQQRPLVADPSARPPPHYVQLDQGKDTYAGASVLRVRVDGGARLAELMELAAAHELDVWSATADFVDLFLPSASSASPAQPEPLRPGQYAGVLHRAGFQFEPFTLDVGALIAGSQAAAEPYVSTHQAVDASSSTADAPGRGSIPLSDPFHSAYRSVEDQSAFLADLARVYPWLATLLPLGESPEGRPLYGLRIGETPADEGQRKKEIVFLSGQHAREWIGPSTALYWAHWLLENSRAADVKPLLRNLDLTIIPNLNGDGYEYSRTSSRLWRKTRQVIDEDSGCIGIDTNRNWGYEWSSSFSASDANPCSEDFPGESAFQAKEVGLVAEYIKTQKTIGFVDLHSYGQLIMYPWAHKCSMVSDAEDLEEVLLGTTKALRKAGGREYKSGQACKLAFRAPGDVVDWTYGQQDIKWSFSMELPDTGTWGFLLPPAQIRPVAEETVEGLLYLAHFVLQKEGGLRRI